jgi:hypothetical protein
MIPLVLLVLMMVLAEGTSYASVQVPLPLQRQELPTIAIWTDRGRLSEQVHLVAWADGEMYYSKDATGLAPHQHAQIHADVIVAVMASEEVRDYLARTSPLVRHYVTMHPRFDIIQVQLDGVLVERVLSSGETNEAAVRAFREFQRYLLSLVPTAEPRDGATRRPPPKFSMYIVQPDGTLLNASIRAGSRIPMRAPAGELVLPVPPGNLPSGWQDPIFCKFERDQALRDGQHKVTLQFAAWPDGLLCWIVNPRSPRQRLAWGTISLERYHQFLEAIAPDFLASDPALDYPVLMTGTRVGPTDIVMDWNGARIGMRSLHPLFDRDERTFYGADGFAPMGEYTREEWMAEQPVEYQQARVYWDIVDLAIAALIEDAEPTEPLVTAPVWLLPPPVKTEGRTTSPPILPGSPVPQSAPGP